jgi:uncharacterized membrane protein
MRKIHRTQLRSILVSIFVVVLSIIHPADFSVHAQADLPVVRAVLFYSPSCGHCHLVIQETILPLIEQYGAQFEIIGVDITQPQGQVFFAAAFKMFDIESAGVPFLVIGNEYLIGSLDIPQKLPGLIETRLAQGGIDWPDIPGLREAIDASQTAQAPTPTDIPPTSAPASIPTQTPAPVILDPDPPPGDSFSLPSETNLTVWQRVMLDPLGNGIAVAVLFVMIAVLAGAILSYRNLPASQAAAGYIIPALCILGLGIAGYLAYVETTHTEAVCGPVGDCNTVQQSAYARLFGILPIGILGVIGYLAILLAWGAAKVQRGESANLARAILATLTMFGLIFSIYLTFLEPFVIGATCAWCVTSAVIMTALFLVTLNDGKLAILELVSARRP